MSKEKRKRVVTDDRKIPLFAALTAAGQLGLFFLHFGKVLSRHRHRYLARVFLFLRKNPFLTKFYFRVCLFTEVERIVTPETSYESLVAMQCAEIEEAMMNEVQRFYIAWNKKLEELKRRNGNQLGAGDSNVMGLGVSGGDMRSM